MKLEGAKALVTGGSEGIGRGIAEALVRKGCDVTITGRHAGALESAAREIGAEWIAGDVGVEADAVRTVAEFVERHGRIDILVNNAGFGRFAPLVEMTLADLDWVRRTWEGPLVVKGVQTVEDAKAVVDHGADAVWLSNHGGRQLDKAPVPLRLAPAVREALGPDAEIMVDTGVMSGADVIAAVALGANSVLVGRAYLYGLMAGGERGVQRAADILATEVRRTMALLGAANVEDLHPGMVELAP